VSGPLGFAGWALALAGFTAAAVLVRRRAIRLHAVAEACHELRGSLTAARLGLELGSRVRQLPQARLRGLELELGRAALALDDLCSASQRRRGTDRVAGHGLREDFVDVAELLRDSVEAWRPAAGMRGVELRLTTDCRVLVVSGDRLRLAQATGNLIANALEHGAGAVEVSLRRQMESVRIEVADAGPGLPAPVAELVGRRRRRLARGLKTDLSRGHGLAIAVAVIAAHGGRLAAAPSERGARLVIELPGLAVKRPAKPVAP
jgi:signal transduction histidine kinase